jgi:hypothetical protein
MSVSDEDQVKLNSAITQWNNSVERYEDVYTKKNKEICVTFGKPFFEQDTNGVYVRGAQGLIKIVSFLSKLIVYIKQCIVYCCI